MSSLRLALKKSMEEAKRGGKGHHPKKHTGVAKHRDENEEGREWDVPRKRGRPKKQPVSRGNDDDEENFSSENEFSVGHADDENGDEDSVASDHGRNSSHEAANRIQKQWKKQHKMKLKEEGEHSSDLSRKGGSTQEDADYGAADQPKKKALSPVPPAKAHSRPTSPEVTEKSSVASVAEQGKSAPPKTGKPRTVPPPSQYLSAWQTNHIAPKRARKNIVPGLRVKKKKKWFGGSIAAVSKEGTKVKIMYDDGTHEITKFPDKDIVIDDTENGEHKAPSDIIEMFLPPEQEEMELTEGGEKEETSKVGAIEDTVRSSSERNDITDQAKLTETPNVVQSAGAQKNDENVSLPTISNLNESTGTVQAMSESARGDITQHSDAESPRKPVLERDTVATTKGLAHSIEQTSGNVLQRTQDDKDSVLSKDASMDDPERSSSTESPADQPQKRKRGRPPKIRPSTDTDALPPNDYSEATAPDFLSPDSLTDPSQQARGPLSIRIPLEKLEHHPPGRSPKAVDTFESPREKHSNKVQSPKGIKRKHSDPSFAGLSTASSDPAGDDFLDSTRSQPSPKQHKKKIRKLLETSEREGTAGVVGDNLAPSNPEPLQESSAPIPAPNNASQNDSDVQEDDALTGGDSRITYEPSSVVYEESDNTPARPRSKQASNEGAPLVRSGRRAAHQANERIVAKVDSSEHPLKIKKKKHQDDELDDHSLKPPEWVQCDRCAKWRVIPSVLVNSLPKQWYCENNVHDPKRASCDAPEQTPREVAKERKRAKKKKQRILEAAATAEGEKHERVRSPYPVENTDELSLSKRSSPDPGTLLENGEDQTKFDRKGGPLGGKKGRPAYASTDTLDSAMDSAPEIRRGRGRPRRSTGHSDKESGHHPSSKGNSDDADNVEWVQCEKCDKWRKLPPHISASELPDVWYCDMNTWSSLLTCDDPEDKADGFLDVGFLGSSGAAGKLSYRNLIFGSTGRKANRPISERTRAAESLFGTIEEGDDVAPVVKYSNCSAFISRSKPIPGCEENKGPSLFEVMQNSSCVSELRSIQSADSKTCDFVETDGTSLILGQTFDTLPTDMKSLVRKLVLEALDTSTSSGEEVTDKIIFKNHESLSDVDLRALSYCSLNVVVTALCALAKEGVLEVVHPSGAMWTVSNWNPRYRKTHYPTTDKSEIHNKHEFKKKETRFMKISKPWKRMQVQ